MNCLLFCKHLDEAASHFWLIGPSSTRNRCPLVIDVVLAMDSACTVLKRFTTVPLQRIWAGNTPPNTFTVFDMLLCFHLLLKQAFCQTTTSYRHINNGNIKFKT